MKSIGAAQPFDRLRAVSNVEPLVEWGLSPKLAKFFRVIFFKAND
jgi:hypothetical protein